MGKEFNLSVSLIATRKAFRQSFSQGVGQIGLEFKNVFSRSQELISPESARFSTLIERRLNPLIGEEDLFWKGHKRSIDDSMRRNIAFLKATGASQEKIDLATAERKSWQQIRNASLSLNEGEAIQFLAQKDVNPEEGVSLQQLAMVNGQLVLQSQLLPFNDIDQINKFISLASQDREDLSADNNISSWVVMGDKIDFDKDIPQMIVESLLTDQPGTMNWQDVAMPQWPQLTQPVILSASGQLMPDRLNEFEDRVISVEPSSFWWQLLAQQASEEIVATELTSKPSEIIVSEKNQLQTQLLEPVKLVESAIAFQAAKKIPVKDKSEFKSWPVWKAEKKKESKPEKSMVVSKSIQTKETLKTTIYQAEKPQKKEGLRPVKKMEEKNLGHVSKISHKQTVNPKVIEKAVIEPKKVEPQIPWWQINFEGIDDNDVPEMPLSNVLWQYFNYLKDLAWLVSIRQFALANTNWTQKEVDLMRVPMMMVDSRGSGWHKKAILLEANRGAKKADIV